MARLHHLMLSSLLVCGGCMYDLNTFELCERDPEACETTVVAWPILSSCTVVEPLEVAIGTGEFAFQDLAAGAAPTLHEGTPVQASTLFHVFVAVKIQNPDPANSKYRVRIRVVEPDPANPGSTRASVTQLVLHDSLRAQSDGSVTRAGVRIFVNAAPVAIALDVEDQCGRHAERIHDIKP